MAVLQVFLSHLHSDHHADLASLYVNAMFGRKVPLEIWGPSSEKPELGLAASIEGLRQVRRPCLCAELLQCNCLLWQSHVSRQAYFCMTVTKTVPQEG